MREFRHGTESATIHLQPMVVTTALARLLRHSHAKVFLTVLLTVPGMTGPTGQSALSHAMGVASPVPEPLNRQCTMEETVQEPVWSCVLATLRNVPVCATKSTTLSKNYEITVCVSTSPSDPCVDAGFHPCYNDDVECTKVTDTEFVCGDCPRGMEGDGINCTGVNEVCIFIHAFQCTYIQDNATCDRCIPFSCST